MKHWTTLAAVVVAFATLSAYGCCGQSSCEGEKKCPTAKECKAGKKCNAVTHATPVKDGKMTPPPVCAVAVWGAAVVGPDGKVLDEVVQIWETPDGQLWVAKRVKPCDMKDAKAVMGADKKPCKLADGKACKPMTKDEMAQAPAAKDVMVKPAAVCPKKGTPSCPAKEHAKSADGKATVCSKTDVPNAKLAPEEGCMIMVMED